ncbi:hypothetical protein BP00DRAFT_132923 [Aspergillus indologenus CBS 114.80]|uniref:Uncharacterized protein n=1 Tax=Aspergillus indologenus CBS 114.80 TaxID=1450541 RepID=A0A2V5IDE5_9EURO|nr:hypothetical protein BP00DRAFT_132923 [Aspergillus indologenus CBS 114.80]
MSDKQENIWHREIPRPAHLSPRLPCPFPHPLRLVHYCFSFPFTFPFDLTRLNIPSIIDWCRVEPPHIIFLTTQSTYIYPTYVIPHILSTISMLVFDADVYYGYDRSASNVVTLIDLLAMNMKFASFGDSVFGLLECFCMLLFPMSLFSAIIWREPPVDSIICSQVGRVLCFSSWFTCKFEWIFSCWVAFLFEYLKPNMLTLGYVDLLFCFMFSFR